MCCDDGMQGSQGAESSEPARKAGVERCGQGRACSQACEGEGNAASRSGADPLQMRSRHGPCIRVCVRRFRLQVQGEARRGRIYALSCQGRRYAFFHLRHLRSQAEQGN